MSCRQRIHDTSFQNTMKRDIDIVRPCRVDRRHDHLTAGIGHFRYVEVLSSPLSSQTVTHHCWASNASARGRHCCSVQRCPDGDIITVSAKRFRHTEVLFQPNSLAVESSALPLGQHKSQRRHPQNVVLSSGANML